MRRAVHWSLVVVWVIAAGASADMQEVETRAEALRRQREKKSQELRPPEPSGTERWLVKLEDGRLFERVLNPAEGLYPKVGNITPGSGFAGGPGYRHPRLIGPVDFSAIGAVSTLAYWKVEGRLRVPNLAGGRLALDGYGQWSDYPTEQFYGIGPNSLRFREARYGLANKVFGGMATLTPRPWLIFTGTVEHMAPVVDEFPEDQPIGNRYAPSEAPGLGEPASTFMRYGGTAEVNYREPRGNPRRGGRYGVSVQRFDDRLEGVYTFDRVEVDLQQYLPLYKDRRVLALRAAASFSGNGTVPFYLQRTLGGPDDLRGFRRFRFRDDNALLLQAEYRWEIFTAMDGAIFYDAGSVAPRPSDLSLDRLDHDWGIGFRFGSDNGVFLRVEGAFGSRDGKHFIMRWGHVF
jgi:hypothetical protein